MTADVQRLLLNIHTILAMIAADQPIETEHWEEYLADAEWWVSRHPPAGTTYAHWLADKLLKELEVMMPCGHSIDGR